MMKKLCFLFLSWVTIFGALVTAGEYLYWIDPFESPRTTKGVIRRALTDGSELCTVLEGIDTGTHLKLGQSGDRLYWMEFTALEDEILRRSNPDGTGVTTLAKLVRGARDFYVDEELGLVYQCDWRGIYRSVIGESERQTVVEMVDHLDYADDGIATFSIFPQIQRLAWMQTGDAKAWLYTANLDGSDITLITSIGARHSNTLLTNRIEYVEDGDWLYWNLSSGFYGTDGSLEFARIFRIHLDGEGEEILLERPYEILNFSLNGARDRVFYADSTGTRYFDIVDQTATSGFLIPPHTYWLTTAILPEPSPTPRLVTHLTAYEGGFQSSITVFNPEPEARAFRLLGFLADGTQADTVEQTVQGNGGRAYAKTEIWPDQDVSHFLIEADGNLKFGAAYRLKDNGGSPVHVSETSRNGFVWLIYPGNPDLVWDGFAAVNLGDRAASIALISRDAAGETVGQTDLTSDLAPMAKLLYVLDPALLPADGFYEVRADQPISLMPLQGPPASETLWENRAISLD